jgi:hypothetical protein
MVLAILVDESVPLGGAIHLIATVDANVASSIDDALVRIVPRLLTDLIALAAAEILVLRRQIALYRERRIKPRRIDAVTRTSLALLSRFFQLAGCSGRGTSRDDDPPSTPSRSWVGCITNTSSRPLECDAVFLGPPGALCCSLRPCYRLPYGRFCIYYDYTLVP